MFVVGNTYINTLCGSICIHVLFPRLPTELFTNTLMHSPRKKRFAHAHSIHANKFETLLLFLYLVVWSANETIAYYIEKSIAAIIFQTNLLIRAPSLLLFNVEAVVVVQIFTRIYKRHNLWALNWQKYANVKSCEHMQ